MSLSSTSLRAHSVRIVVTAALAFVVGLPALNAHAANEAYPDDATPATAKLETDSYRVEITATGPYKAGAKSSVRVALTTKGAFHINPQYPYRFKAKPAPEGVTYPKPILERGDGQFEEKKAFFDVPFVASHAGKFEVGGIFHMSVCSAGSCIVEKAPLEVSISVE